MRACTWRHAQAYVEQSSTSHARVIGLVLGLGLVPVPVCRCRWVVDGRCQGAGARVPVSMARFRCGRFALLLPTLHATCDERSTPCHSAASFTHEPLRECRPTCRSKINVSSPHQRARLAMYALKAAARAACRSQDGMRRDEAGQAQAWPPLRCGRHHRPPALQRCRGGQRREVRIPHLWSSRYCTHGGGDRDAKLAVSKQ